MKKVFETPAIEIFHMSVLDDMMTVSGNPGEAIGMGLTGQEGVDEWIVRQ